MRIVQILLRTRRKLAELLLRQLPRIFNRFTNCSGIERYGLRCWLPDLYTCTCTSGCGRGRRGSGQGRRANANLLFSAGVTEAANFPNRNLRCQPALLLAAVGILNGKLLQMGATEFFLTLTDTSRDLPRAAQ
jgi:hypothetical protein